MYLTFVFLRLVDYVQGLKCPVCSKFILPDDIECHLVMCLTKPRLSYNGELFAAVKYIIAGNIVNAVPYIIFNRFINQRVIVLCNEISLTGDWLFQFFW